jgi:two-component system, cell cycle response regulator
MDRHLTQTDDRPTIDAITGFGNREALLTDLEAALEPDREPCVLAVFHLAGAEDHRRVNGYGASDKLIAQLASAFAEIMAPRAQLYRSRQDEFWALIDGPIDHARPLLGAATAALRRTGVQANVSAAFGMAFLPAEATEPTEALMIADQELGVARRARERRKLPRSQRRRQEAP